MENKHNKKPLIVMLVLMLGLIVGGVYTYWAGDVGNPEPYEDNQEVLIGQGESVQTELNVTKALASEGKKLVPAGKAIVSAGGEAENVESFDVTYTVYWQESGDMDIIDADDLIECTLTVQATPSIQNAQEHSGLVNVAVDPSTAQITADGDAVEVQVRVTLTEPADKATYDSIAGQTINVQLTFTVE